LKLWFVLRWYGAEGVRDFLRGHVAVAGDLAGWIEADGRFEVVAPHPFSLVCFRLTDAVCGGRQAADAANEELLGRLNSSGALYLTHTKVRDAYALRMAIGGVATKRHHVEAAWQRISTEAAGVLRG
jgi:aromatic-L-amino-acid decarboxylase